MEILCFFAGVVFFYLKSPYPLLFVAIALFFCARWYVIAWFLVAMIWAYGHQWWVSDLGMPEIEVISKANLLGTVLSIPSTDFSKTQFQFSIRRLNDKPVQAIALLSCYNHCPTFKTGQTWQLQAKLKVPKNLGNPGSMDYQGGLSAHHIGWTGYLKQTSLVLQDCPIKKSAILSLRERLSATLKQNIAEKSVRGVVEALTLGLTSDLDKAQWDLFRRTGTTHLMVISGAHISLVAGIAYWLLKKLWSLSTRLCLFRPAAQMAGLGALIVVYGYALLAGFAVPAQRALVVCFFVMLRHFLSRRFTAWQAWRYALFAVLIFEPHTVLLPGFYLSFVAVATLIASSQRIRKRGIQKALYLQIACLLGLMPLTLYWFSYGAINGLVANLIAIPLVGYIIVPLSLVSLFLVHIFALPVLMIPVSFVIKVLLFYLEWVDQFAMINLSFSLTNTLSVFALMLGSMLLFFIPLKIFFPAAITILVAALFPGYSQVKKGDAHIAVLDVGQGLAVVVNTATHTLIYDTGMKFYQGGDMGKMAIIPYLETFGIKKIDKLVISHPDLDHRGGLPSLAEKYPIDELLVDNVPFYKRGKNCHQYPNWTWDGVSFRFFSIKATFRDKNNSSCVLQISNSAGRVLLPGDIEKLAENYLVNTYGKNLASDYLLVAHHGSKTSSSPIFIKQVSPRFAIISAGFDNRYHFPHQETINTLTEQNSGILNTTTCGMATIKLLANKQAEEPVCYISHK